MSRIGAFLRDQLVLRGETPERFGERVGLNASGLYQLMRGEKQNPTLDTLTRIASGLGMSAADMLAVVDGRAPGGEPVAPDLANVIAIWPHLEEGRRDAIRALASPTPRNTPPHGAPNRTGRLVTGNPRRRNSGEEGRQNRALRALPRAVMGAALPTVTAFQAVAA